MSRRHAGSLEPDDEVMPYSDDETDDELDASTEDEGEEPPGASQPPAEPQTSGEIPTQDHTQIRVCDVTLRNNLV